MAIIYSYPINTNILATDIIVGSSTVIVNGRPKNQTKSFEIQDLAAYFASAILPPGSYVPYTGAVGSVNLGIHNLTAASIIKAGGTNLQYLMADGSISTGTFVPAAALTKTDDTNVTLTLGGSPATALLAATSLTLGWSGTLADSRITSAAIWNAKQDAITLTTTGTGAATFVANVLNIPNYSSSLSGTINRVSKFNTTTSISDSTIEDNGSSVIINRPNGSTSGYKLDVNGPVFCDYGTSNVINVPSAININMPYYNLVGGTPDASIVNINGKGPLANGYMTGYNVQVSGPDNAGFFGDFSDTSAASIGIRLNSRPLHTGDFVNYNKYIGSTPTIVHKIDNAGNVTSASYIKTGGTNLQFLMADGSVSTAPSLTGFVPYTGATQAVNLGAFDLTVNGAIIGRGGGQDYTNTMLGISNGANNVSGTYNTSIGFNAGVNNVSGLYNSALGGGALQLSTTGASNIAFGIFALYNNTTGSFNTAVGTNALFANTTGSNNVGIGINTQTLNSTDNNSIMIGESVTGAGSNTVVIGNSSITTTRLRGAVQGLSFVKDFGTAIEYLMADGSITTSGPLFKATNNVGGTGVISVISPAIIGSLFPDGSILRIQTMVTFGPSQTLNITPITYYINTSPSLVGATQIATFDISAGQRYSWMDRSFWSVANTFNARNFLGSSSTSVSNSGAILGSTSIPATFYIIASMNVGVGDLGTMASILVEKI